MFSIERKNLGSLQPADLQNRAAIVLNDVAIPADEPGRALAEFVAAGGALLPGLHDHHLHLFALAAADASLRCGPPEVRNLRALADALDAAFDDLDWAEYYRDVAESRFASVEQMVDYMRLVNLVYEYGIDL